MGVNRKTIISEVEDAMRKQSRDATSYPIHSLNRQEHIDTAAWILLAVETGDNDAVWEAEEAHKG